jgi:hypothetical protein
VESVYVFSAPLEDNIALSQRSDGSNLPASNSGFPWVVMFQIVLSEATLRGFRLDSGSALASLRETGIYVGRPAAGLFRFRPAPCQSN